MQMTEMSGGCDRAGDPRWKREAELLPGLRAEELGGV